MSPLSPVRSVLALIVKRDSTVLEGKGNPMWEKRSRHGQNQESEFTSPTLKVLELHFELSLLVHILQQTEANRMRDVN